ncbi:AAA family ATPase [Methylophaga thiooxydans]|uniref:AAA family ATPase n=1 Tax=Methylophaga thiooxydans TaxID=392484 RepID=UPI0023544E6D|nr:AAA family ATPase [Methylophaga thiooxydans]
MNSLEMTSSVKCEVDSSLKHRSIKTRLISLLDQIGAGLHEREQTIAVSLLAALSGQNTFLYGPPGTAKSLISRRLACAFEEPDYYEHLMNRFTTPEEVFGPISIKELKADNYLRKTQGYLATADFAFLDEIWKSSPAILNTLLTLINEHLFKNGDRIEEVPLKALISASNEVPEANQGLDALYDRFIVRLVVPPIVNTEHFNSLLNSKPSSSNPEIDPELKINFNELKEWREAINEVRVNDDCLTIITAIKSSLAEQFDEIGVYVSDRRWQRSALLMKASAFFNGRNSTNHSDALLLQHCLWTTPDNRDAVKQIVFEAIEASGFTTDINLAQLDIEKEQLDKEIHKELYYDKDIYDTVTLSGDSRKKYFKVIASFKERGFNSSNKTRSFYIPYSEFKSKTPFKLVDKSGNELDDLEATFDSQGSCIISLTDYSYFSDYTFTPKVLHEKGKKRADVNSRLVSSLALSVTNTRNNLSVALEDLLKRYSDYKCELDTPFSSSRDIEIALRGISNQIEQVKLRISDCERLESLCSQ